MQPFKNKALRPPQPLTSAWMPSLVTWSHQEMFNCSNSGHPSLRTKQNETNMTKPNSKGTKVSFYCLLNQGMATVPCSPLRIYFHNTDLEYSQSNNSNNNKVYLSILVVFTWDSITGKASSNPAKLVSTKHNNIFQICEIVMEVYPFQTYSFCTYHMFKRSLESKWEFSDLFKLTE